MKTTLIYLIDGEEVTVSAVASSIFMHFGRFSYVLLYICEIAYFSRLSMLYHSNTAAGWKIICRFLDEFDS